MQPKYVVSSATGSYLLVLVGNQEERQKPTLSGAPLTNSCGGIPQLVLENLFSKPLAVGAALSRHEDELPSISLEFEL